MEGPGVLNVGGMGALMSGTLVGTDGRHTSR